jgi:ABC-type transport system substrate-binding protein
MSAIRYLASFCVFFLATSAAFAGAVPPEGMLAITFTSTAITVPKPMSIGGGKEFTVLNQAMTATNDTGNPVMNNMGGRCQYTRLVDTVAKTFELHGFCTYADSDGDQIIEQFDFLPGAPGHGKYLGGTGKFEGLQGNIEITISPLKGTFDGITQAIGHKKGSYKIIKK